MSPDDVECPNCKTPVSSRPQPEPPNSFQLAATAAAAYVKSGFNDAIQAFKVFATDPVSRLPRAYEILGSRALNAGLFLGGIATTFILILMIRISGESPGHEGFLGFLKLAIASLVPFLALAGCAFAARVACDGAGGFGSDIFIAGTSLIPVALIGLIVAIFGVHNGRVFSLLTCFATTVPVLMLFSGLTRICRLSERVASLAVPLTLLLSSWLSWEIYSRILGGGSGF